MKHVFLTAILLLAGLSALPSASASAGADADAVAVQPCQQQPGYRDCTVSAAGCTAGFWYYQHDGIFHPVAHCEKPTSAASAPVDCHGPLDGYQTCEATVGACHAGETYQAGSGVHAHAECQPTDGKSRCGVDAYATPVVVTRHCRGDEQQVYPVSVGTAAAAPPCTVDNVVVQPGYVNADLDCGRVLFCHVNNVEDGYPPCTSAVAGCAEDALGTDVLGPWGECDAGLTAASDAGTGCQRYPGYERCDYTVGPCTVTTYYYFHDAFYRVDGPTCEKPATTATTAAAPAGSACERYNGYERCEYGAKPCTVTTYHYFHDSRYVVEVCGLVVIDPSGASTAGTGTSCEEHPGYRQCDYAVGPCTVTTYYFYHDAFYAVDGPTCDKPTVRSCEEHPGYERCDHTVGPCTVTTYYFYHDAFYAVDGPTCLRA